MSGAVGIVESSKEATTPTNGLDPELAFLDPTQYQQSGPSSSTSYASMGTFNRLTGRFVGPGPATSSGPGDSSNMGTESGGAGAGAAMDPTPIRAKRQLNHYFDVDEWEAKQKSKSSSKSSSKSRHPPTKKELEMYKRQKLEKKKRGMGWLHS